ncbi:hypothetical protein M378DRAFT_597092 [Amanita muscaria Koide BX008]|uniref:Uncharacterized protein n=1 Tax=Amanita muscaria (strain Koide BX008) TaxID=946122 RepID=A0A0C2RYM5_AMAMK|nr:hypothetical protein M378DRAFT_597092 [Amanita muscaria Koide BX008]
MFSRSIYHSGLLRIFFTVNIPELYTINSNFTPRRRWTETLARFFMTHPYASIGIKVPRCRDKNTCSTELISTAPSVSYASISNYPRYVSLRAVALSGKKYLGIYAQFNLIFSLYFPR